jgi:hypothetical protein
MLSIVRNVMAFCWLMIFVVLLATILSITSNLPVSSTEGLR